MKNTSILLLLMGAMMILPNCGEKDNGKDENTEPLTPEANKTLIQNTGVEFFAEMSAMQKTSSVQSLTSFALLMEDEEENAAGRTTNNILGFANGKVSTIEFGHQSYRVNQSDEEDFTSFQELFDEKSGVYEWNAEADSFQHTPNNDGKIIFNYPSTEDGTSNNASLILSNYTGTTIANPIDDEYTGDLPTSLDVELKVDGTTEMTYGFDVNYNSEGVPESVKTSLTLNSYSLSVDLTNTKTNIGATVNFSNDSKTIIEVSTGVTGTFTDDAIQNAEDSDNPTKVVNDGNFALTILNLKFSADLQFASLYNAVGGNTFEDSYNEYPGNTDPKPDLEANAKLLENALNEHAKLDLTYVDTKHTAANIEWYTFVETESYDQGTDYRIELGATMIFEDGSKVDVEDFLETGFEELETAINNLIHQIEQDIHEDIEDIDFDA